MSALAQLPSFKETKDVDLANPRYLEFHKQLISPAWGKVEILSYDMVSNQWKTHFTVDEFCDPEYFPGGFALLCRASKVLEIYKFTKVAAEKKGEFEGVESAKAFEAKTGRVLLLL